jgi:hypothetical protein
MTLRQKLESSLTKQDYDMLMAIFRAKKMHFQTIQRTFDQTEVLKLNFSVIYCASQWLGTTMDNLVKDNVIKYDPETLERFFLQATVVV